MNSAVEYTANRFLRRFSNSGDECIRSNCPFCESKKAFVMNKDSGVFLCFSCESKGALPQFLIRMGCSKSEIDSVVDNLPRIRKRQKKDDSYCILPEYILGAYSWCPNKLVRAGYSPKFLMENDIGYDRLQSRITFPIRDIKGNLVAISGRADNDNMYPRYKVYVDELRHIVDGYKPRNRHFLYNLHSIDLSSDKPLFIVEGYKACLWMKMHGCDAVALQGSGMTKSQYSQLISIRKKTLVFLDHEYGKQIPPQSKEVQHAALNIARKLEPYNQVEMVVYPEGSPERYSPDDLTGDEIRNLKTIKLNKYILKLKLEGKNLCL